MAATVEGAEVVAVTDSALERIRQLWPVGPEGDELALWIEATSADSEAGDAYDIYLYPADQAGGNDHVAVHEGLTIVVPSTSLDLVSGSILDVVDDDPETLTIRLNEPQSPEMGSLPRPLTGDLFEQVATVIRDQINPAIAMHGGQAELVGVDGDEAKVRLHGGCQGCGMAAVTLYQGIAASITAAIPAIAKVVDVTNHAEGVNPYFASAGR